MDHLLPIESQTLRQTRRVNLKLDANHRWSTQGTKLGPILFLVRVNDLKTHQNIDNWKFVDVISVAEALSRDAIPASQSNLERTAIRTNYNWMKLNASKCKEMLTCFFRKRPKIQPLCVKGKVLETVKSHKVLGLIIQDNLKWNKHIEMSTRQSVETSSHHTSATARGRSTT